MPSKLRVRTFRRMLITWSAFNVWLPLWLMAVGVCPTRSDLKSWICFRLHVEDWEVIRSLRTTYPMAPWIYPLRNSLLGHLVPAFEDITLNCIIGVSDWTEGRPPSPFGSPGPGTRCQPMLSNRHLLMSSSPDWTHVGMRCSPTSCCIPPPSFATIYDS